MRDLERRITRLEKRLGPIEMPKFVVIVEAIAAQRCNSLGLDERIVQDWYSDVGGYVLARERITTDPADQGQRCAAVGSPEART